MRYPVPLLSLLLLAACATTAPPPPAAAPAPAPKPTPPPPPPPSADWRDAPLSPGAWRYQPEADGSAAIFGANAISLHCNKAARLVTLGGAGLTGPLQVITSFGTYTVAAPLAARDPVLDSIAFSRGRFVVSAANAPQNVLPAWPEVGRVIEDCRE